ncbi:hypothetical protein Bpfe_002553, partial [Biomphalaria pfeifferi]
EPNNKGDWENCVHYHFDNFSLNDNYCGYSFNFICEKPVEMKPITIGEWVSKEYERVR